MSSGLILALVVTLTVVVVVADWWVKRRVAATLALRPAVPFAEIHRLHYAATGIGAELAEAHWNGIARALCCDPRRMRPDDRLGEDVGKRFNTVDLFAELEDYVADHARKHGTSVDASPLVTVDNCMRYLISLDTGIRTTA